MNIRFIVHQVRNSPGVALIACSESCSPVVGILCVDVVLACDLQLKDWVVTIFRC